MIITEKPYWTIIATYGTSEYLKDENDEIRTWDQEQDAIDFVHALLQNARSGQRYLVHRREPRSTGIAASQCVYDVKKEVPWTPGKIYQSRSLVGKKRSLRRRS